MKNPLSAASRRSSAALLAPAAALLVVGGVLIATAGRRPAPLAATTLPDQRDMDGDGIVDRQERVLDTSLTAVDTDQDGFSDAEELARRSSPLFPEMRPEGGLQLGMTARAEPDGLHALVAVYLPDHDIQAVTLRVGVMFGRRVIQLPQDLLAYGNVNFVPAADPNAVVALIDFPFSETWIDLARHVTLFVTAARVGSPIVHAAHTVEFSKMHDVVVLLVPDATMASTLRNLGNLTVRSGGVIKPLTDDGSAPDGWEPGEVCHQTSQAVSVNGSVITSEVVSAECQSGWEGACPPDCSSSVGTTYSTLDPVVLVGG